MKRILLLVILIFVLLPCTACEGELPPVEEVIDNMVEAMDEVESFRQDVDMTMHLYFMAEDTPSFFPLEMDIELDAVTAYDLVNNDMKTVMDLVITGADDESVKMDMAFYIVDMTMYVMVDYPLLSPMWMKSEIPRMYLQEMDDFQIPMELFQMMGMEIIGTERKEGINCYVLEVTPDISQIFASLMLPAEEFYSGNYESDFEIIEEIFQDFSMKLWVAHDTYRIVFADINMGIEFSPEMMGVYDEEGLFSLDITVMTHYHHYNTSMEIDLPQEAENADEESLW